MNTSKLVRDIQTMCYPGLMLSVDFNTFCELSDHIHGSPSTGYPVTPPAPYRGDPLDLLAAPHPGIFDIHTRVVHPAHEQSVDVYDAAVAWRVDSAIQVGRSFLLWGGGVSPALDYRGLWLADTPCGHVIAFVLPVMASPYYYLLRRWTQDAWKKALHHAWGEVRHGPSKYARWHRNPEWKLFWGEYQHPGTLLSLSALFDGEGTPPRAADLLSHLVPFARSAFTAFVFHLINHNLTDKHKEQP